MAYDVSSASFAKLSGGKDGWLYVDYLLISKRITYN